MPVVATVLVVRRVVRRQGGREVSSSSRGHLVEHIELLVAATDATHRFRQLLPRRRRVVDDPLVDEQRGRRAVAVDESLGELALDDRLVQPMAQQGVGHRVDLGVATYPTEEPEDLAGLSL